MCYKADLQRKNEEKLQEKFAEDSVPMFIREAVVLRISSRQTRLNAWATVKTMLLWMIEKEYIHKHSIPTTEIFEKTLNQIMAELDDKSSDEAEGFVVNVDGYKVKVKYNDYVHIHKALSKFSNICK